MAKKNPKIPNHMRKDLEGFEDLIDNFLEEKEQNALKNNLLKDKDVETHKTYNYLEIEKERVERISAMLTRRIPNMIEHSQSDELIEKFTVYNYNLKENLVRHIKRYDSTFNQNLKDIFNKAFRKRS